MQNGRTSKVLMRVTVPVVSDENCFDRMGIKRNRGMEPYLMCAAPAEGETY